MFLITVEDMLYLSPEMWLKDQSRIAFGNLPKGTTIVSVIDDDDHHISKTYKKAFGAWLMLKPYRTRTNDLRSTNNAEGWAHYYIGHHLKSCGCKTLAEAITNLKKSIERANMYNERKIGSDRLSDNECVLSSHKDWMEELSLFDEFDVVYDDLMYWYGR